ncbi:MAG: hypothetical protein CMG75_02740 [Candidatus Marinimicrobia bacterium]|nr:hypothetical protein [Candidatus Neomarinimicrobiota bacterium]|tara:strand:- start:32315 stop:33208 length:894 start_codon:yes stop_codon:yes gene_type:complete
MTTGKIIILVNPQGGNKKGPKIVRDVVPILENSNIKFEIIQTEYKGHAEKLSQELDLEEVCGLCQIGGDGTFHELVNGLLSREDGKKVPLGYIPGGTGNSFMYDLECLEPLEAIKRIIKGETKQIDVVEVMMPNEKIFCINIVGWGMVTDINIAAEKLRWMKGQRYNIMTVLHALKLKKRSAQILIDDQEINGKFLFAIACNTKHTGRGMKMAPKSELNDGLIDLILVRNASRIKLLQMFPKIFDGSHIEDPIVEYYQVKSFSIMPSDDEFLNLDGELKGKTPFSAKVIPSAISVFI